MSAKANMPAWMKTYPEIIRGLGYYCTNNAKTHYTADIVRVDIWDESSTEAHWRDRPEGSPFLAVFNFNGTHKSAVFRRDPFVVDPNQIRLPAYLPDTREIREDFAQYYKDVRGMDQLVGELLHQLEEDALRESTIITQTSDHGGVYPRSKRYYYDEGLHVPLIIQASGRYQQLFPAPGTRVVSVVSTLSVPPTLIELAGGEIPASMQMESLVRRSYDPTGDVAFGMRIRRDERCDMIRTVRDARYRYIRNYMPHRPYAQHQGFAWLAAGYQSWEKELLASRLNAVQEAFWQQKPAVELYDPPRTRTRWSTSLGRAEHAEVERRVEGLLRNHMLADQRQRVSARGLHCAGLRCEPKTGSLPA